MISPAYAGFHLLYAAYDILCGAGASRYSAMDGMNWPCREYIRDSFAAVTYGKALYGTKKLLHLNTEFSADGTALLISFL
ncbi:hypothetical protein BBD41_25950 [Paenibacillus ihbetae]|uniref:Uncharacterized protein n=1 Tax=Paenibacillus ihbetae TaxID=1870820 RepID=A0A1B2E6Z0_9BACL|nr:hypothetical protein BBD41_25950 [Paenibacillus ihbetae]